MFRRVTWNDFQEVVTQVRHPFARYNRATYQNVVIYDFLMPLTREDKLRKALDELFLTPSTSASARPDSPRWRRPFPAAPRIPTTPT
jgi:hypothetical protein